jgi:Uma2 family endonuclease
MALPARISPPDPLPAEAPTAPTADEWAAMTPAQREQATDALLASDSVEENEEREAMAEGDPHLDAKMGARNTLRSHFERLGRRTYVGADIAAFYPGKKGFTPDVIAVNDVDQRSRECWMVAAEGKGIDLALEVHYKGDWRKDFVNNVKKYAALGIREYFIHDIRRGLLRGYELPHEGAAEYALIAAHVGRYRSNVLDLDLALEGDQLRFYASGALLVTDRELVGKLEQMVDAAVARAGQEEVRAEQATTQLASAILMILQVRGLAVTDDASDRIRGCSDLAILERWLGRAAAVATSEDLFLDA